MKKALTALDAVLASRTFLVGDRVTLADVVGACNLWLGFTKLFDAGYRSEVPNVARWFDTLVHQPAFVKVLGEVPLADKAAVYDAAAAKKAAAMWITNSTPSPQAVTRLTTLTALTSTP